MTKVTTTGRSLLRRESNIPTNRKPIMTVLVLKRNGFPRKRSLTLLVFTRFLFFKINCDLTDCVLLLWLLILIYDLYVFLRSFGVDKLSQSPWNGRKTPNNHIISRRGKRGGRGKGEWVGIRMTRSESAKQWMSKDKRSYYDEYAWAVADNVVFY